MSFQKDGTFAAVWLALDTLDTCHVYDAAILRREVPVVIAQCLEARGRWIPLAWAKSIESIKEELLTRGINMMHEPVSETDEALEVAASLVEERMRSGRFRVSSRLRPWHEEMKSFRRAAQAIPREGYPLMLATQHAIARLSYARKLGREPIRRRNYPNIKVL